LTKRTEAGPKTAETTEMQDENLKNALVSIEMYLNKTIFRCDTNLRTIHEALIAGRLVGDP
jgi:hypothetical protein